MARCSARNVKSTRTGPGDRWTRATSLTVGVNRPPRRSVRVTCLVNCVTLSFCPAPMSRCRSAGSWPTVSALAAPTETVSAAATMTKRRRSRRTGRAVYGRPARAPSTLSRRRPAHNPQPPGQPAHGRPLHGEEHDVEEQQAVGYAANDRQRGQHDGDGAAYAGPAEHHPFGRAEALT